MNSGMEMAVTRALLHFVWEGAGIAVVLAAALWVGRRARAQVRYVMASVAMVAMVLAFAGTVAWFWPHSSAAEELTMAVQQLEFKAVAPARATGTAPVRLLSPEWAARIWMLGVAVFSLRSLIAWLAAMRLRRVGTRVAGPAWQERLKALSAMLRVSRPVALLESMVVDVPVVIGWLKPVILAPASLLTGFPAEQLELILLHELEHVRRHDYLVNLLQSVVEDVLFYHPAVWWVSAVMRAEREHCCDDAVVAAKGDARGLAEALAELEESRWSAYEAALAANGGQLMGRIQRLLKGRSSSGLIAGPAFSAGLLAAGITLMVMLGHAQDATPRVLQAPPAAPAPPQLSQEAAQVPAPPPAAAIPTVYEMWLNEEVFWIITPQERQEFRGLKSDEERQQFIEQFWLKRDPTPGTAENEFEEEFYRRLAYVNENFSTGGVPGWKTDRGSIYIKYGRPDERDEHPTGGTYERPIEEGGGTTETYPFERWRYRYIQGVGNDVWIEFVDTTRKGEYRMTADPATKDALLYVPGAGLTLYEQMGLADKSDRFLRTDGTRLGTGTMPLPDAPKCTLDEVTGVLNCQIPLRHELQK